MDSSFPSPNLQIFQAHIFVLLLASSYVGSLYASKNARLSFMRKSTPDKNGAACARLRWRDDPGVIRARLAAVTVATLFSCAIIVLILASLNAQRILSPTVLDDARIRLGFISTAPRPHLITPLLFLGPGYVHLLGETLPLQRNWSFHENIRCLFLSWQGVRNYVLGPITEEIVFRACVLCLYHLAGASRIRVIFLSPLVFGLAHVHHAWDTFNQYGCTRSAAKRAAIMTLFQLTYTTLFGFHCSYLFLRTGSILPPISAHVFCNVMGVPALLYELERFPTRKFSILVAYVVGIMAFVYTLPRWTRTSDNLYWLAD